MKGTDHYFSPRPAAPSRPRLIRDTLRGQALVLETDAGVFSGKRIDPGSRLLVESVDLPAEGELLDLGCGYGAIGLACALAAPALRVTMVDVNERAVELAKRNAARNGAANVEILLGDGFQALHGRRFDLILTNPPFRQGKELVGQWLQEAKDHLRPGGRLALVVRTRQGARSWRGRLEAWYGHCREVSKKGGYRVYEVTAAT